VIINGVASNFKMLNSGLMWDQWIFLGSWVFKQRFQTKLY
jgi:hypothetical protein